MQDQLDSVFWAATVTGIVAVAVAFINHWLLKKRERESFERVARETSRIERFKEQKSVFEQYWWSYQLMLCKVQALFYDTKKSWSPKKADHRAFEAAYPEVALAFMRASSVVKSTTVNEELLWLERECGTALWRFAHATLKNDLDTAAEQRKKCTDTRHALREVMAKDLNSIRAFED